MTRGESQGFDMRNLIRWVDKLAHLVIRFCEDRPESISNFSFLIHTYIPGLSIPPHGFTQLLHLTLEL